jgi:transposase InsO family protein
MQVHMHQGIQHRYWLWLTGVYADTVPPTPIRLSWHLRLQAHRAKVAHKQRLLSDNGSSYISSDLAEWLKVRGLPHVRGAPCHPLARRCFRAFAPRTVRHMALPVEGLAENAILSRLLENPSEC